jgi:hypothetical protein
MTIVASFGLLFSMAVAFRLQMHWQRIFGMKNRTPTFGLRKKRNCRIQKSGDGRTV